MDSDNAVAETDDGNSSCVENACCTAEPDPGVWQSDPLEIHQAK